VQKFDQQIVNLFGSVTAEDLLGVKLEPSTSKKLSLTGEKRPAAVGVRHQSRNHLNAFENHPTIQRLHRKCADIDWAMMGSSSTS